MDDRRIGDLLVDAGLVTRPDLEGILDRAKVVGERRILSELFALGLANERQLAEALAKRLGAPVAVLTECVVDLAIVKMVPAHVMRETKALPIAADAHTVTVVALDPDAPSIKVPLGFATGRRVVTLIGIQAILEEYIEEVLRAVDQGRQVFAGPKATSVAAHVAVARAKPVGKDEANELAKQIVTALTDDHDDASGSIPIGALRLKQVTVNRKAGADQLFDGPIEGALEHPEELAIAFAELPTTSPGDPIALVVDDDDAIRTMLRRVFEHDGLTVIEARNGTEAVSLLRLMRPHVVVLDAMLPGVHGFEICQALKRSHLKDVPVIMISAVYRGWMQAREIQEVHGADYFIEKPFELTYVRRMISQLLARPQPRPVRSDELKARIEAARRAYNEHAKEGLVFAATADLETWISLDPFDGAAWLERGNLCGLSGDLVGAMAAYEVACVYDPTLLVAHIGLAMTYEQLGFLRRALLTWTRARELAPDDATRAKIDQHLG